MTKTEFTALVLLKLNTELSEQQPQLTKTHLWWRNPNAHSMRLSDLGYEIFFQHSGLDRHYYTGPGANNSLTLLKLDRQITNPYWYCRDRKTGIYDLLIFGCSKEIMWLNLYNDLDRFLQVYNVDK